MTSKTIPSSIGAAFEFIKLLEIHIIANNPYD
jgi:hypothetical protein